MLGRVDKRDSQGGLIVIQTGICDGDQLGTRPDVGRGVGVSRALHSGRPRPERAQAHEPPPCFGWDFLDRPDGFSVARLAGRVREMVQCLPPVPALDPGRAVGTDPRSAERKPDRARRAPDDRQHRYPRPSSGSGRKRGTPQQGFGRSRGGFTTKIHLRVNGAGLPMRSDITPGQTSDYLGFDLVMDDNLPEPRVLLADRGYDADRVRKTMEDRNVVPVIPMRKSRKLRVAIDRKLYRLRNLVERCFNKLKNARRVATRYDKTAESFLGFIDITSIRLWLRHLST